MGHSRLQPATIHARKNYKPLLHEAFGLALRRINFFYSVKKFIALTLTAAFIIYFNIGQPSIFARHSSEFTLVVVCVSICAAHWLMSF